MFIYSRHFSGNHGETPSVVLLIYFLVAHRSGAVIIWEKKDTWSELLDGQDAVFMVFFFLWQLILCLTFFLTHLSYAFLFCQKKEKNDILTKCYLYCHNWTERKKVPDWWISEGNKLLKGYVMIIGNSTMKDRFLLIKHPVSLSHSKQKYYGL